MLKRIMAFIAFEGMNWIFLAQDIIQWLAVMNTENEP
jgi:hypothetical protein